MRKQFINSWVTQQQRAFQQSTRGVMNPKARWALEEEAEQVMAEIECKAAEEAWDEAEREITKSIGCSFCHGDAPYPENPYRKEQGNE